MPDLNRTKKVQCSSCGRFMSKGGLITNLPYLDLPADPSTFDWIAWICRNPKHDILLDISKDEAKTELAMERVDKTNCGCPLAKWGS